MNKRYKVSVEYNTFDYDKNCYVDKKEIFEVASGAEVYDIVKKHINNFDITINIEAV